MIDWDPSIKKKVNYLSCIEGKGGLKAFQCIAQNAAQFVDLLWNIFYAAHLMGFLQENWVYSRTEQVCFPKAALNNIY